MNSKERGELIYAIASRKLTASKLATLFDVTVSDLKDFMAANRPMVEAEYARQNAPQTSAEPTPNDLDALWITNKTARLKRLQVVAEITYRDIITSNLSPAELATNVREFRSYLTVAANELGQLLHRGSGESGSGDYLSVEIAGVDMETLR